LFRNRTMAIVPPPLSEPNAEEPLEVIPVLRGWVRGLLVGVVLGLVAVFSAAIWLNPYKPDGTPRTMATHTQFGLNECTFFKVTGLPCPSCGMTTSFALLMHGDVVNSLRANAVGTLLALFCLALIPWGIASVALNRPVFIRSLERALTVVVMVLLGLMMLRWVVVLGWAWYFGKSFGP
jgi:hypothetical protein